MNSSKPILVTGAAGNLGGVGRTVAELLLARGLPVRAMVHRDDDRAATLRAAGAEVVVGDLLEPADVYRVVNGSSRVYFGMSVSAEYLEATVTMATVARELGVEALVNMSQMTVSQMSIQHTTPSPQQRQHWLAEQTLQWSGLPVVTVRPTVFLEGFFLKFIAQGVRERDHIEVPFGRQITYVDAVPADWARDLKKLGLADHVYRHLVTMAELHRANRYDRLADGVHRVTGQQALSIREFVSQHADEFGGQREHAPRELLGRTRYGAALIARTSASAPAVRRARSFVVICSC